MGGAEVFKAYNMNVRLYKDVGHGINHEIADEINKTVIDIVEGRLGIVKK